MSKKPQLTNANSEKWGKDVIAAGYTNIPNMLITHWPIFGLDSVDFHIITVISKHWWGTTKLAQISKNKLAKMLCLDPNTVRRRINKLEAGGFITQVTSRNGKLKNANIYLLDGLVKILQEHAPTELRKRELTKEIQEHPIRHKGKPAKLNLRVVAS